MNPTRHADATSRFRRILSHPLTAGLDIDDPGTTHLRRAVIEDKPFLKRIYREWYGLIAEELPAGAGPVVELGSGAGFLSEFVPGLVSSEVFLCERVRLVFDGQTMPFRSGSLRGIAMTNVLHHIPSLPAFLAEADRCLRPGGRIVALEPWVSKWSKAVYTRLHHEPFEPDAKEWRIDGKGPLSAANGALPWIVFERDRQLFETGFPNLKVRKLAPMMPFRYLACGGIFSRNMMPSATFPLWKAFESALSPWMRSLAMFALVVVEKV